MEWSGGCKSLGGVTVASASMVGGARAAECWREVAEDQMAQVAVDSLFEMQPAERGVGKDWRSSPAWRRLTSSGLSGSSWRARGDRRRLG